MWIAECDVEIIHIEVICSLALKRLTLQIFTASILDVDTIWCYTSGICKWWRLSVYISYIRSK